MFGMSFIYIIFEDNVDPYWARTRVQTFKLCSTIVATKCSSHFRPDGTGVGIFWYHLETDGMDLGEQRALQEYVKFALQTVPGVAEVASFGGFENNIWF
jgi:Cu(I)/Ag(I) efflux system membrane protein CusA/SilA